MEERGRVVDVTRVKWVLGSREKVLPAPASASGCIASVDTEVLLAQSSNVWSNAQIHLHRLSNGDHGHASCLMTSPSAVHQFWLSISFSIPSSSRSTCPPQPRGAQLTLSNRLDPSYHPISILSHSMILPCDQSRRATMQIGGVRQPARSHPLAESWTRRRRVEESQ